MSSGCTCPPTLYPAETSDKPEKLHLMKIAYIASYFPRECGIATFTEHLIKAVCRDADDVPEVSVIAMNDEGQVYEYPPEVTFTIRQNHMEDYLNAAAHVNSSDVDLVVVQHEFGIF